MSPDEVRTVLVPNELLKKVQFSERLGFEIVDEELRACVYLQRRTGGSPRLSAPSIPLSSQPLAQRTWHHEPCDALPSGGADIQCV